jgi:type II secretion system protein H
MRQGYTLVEILVVLLIISVMSAMVLPRVAGHINSIKLRTAAQKTVAILRYARDLATSERTIYTVTLDPDKKRIVFFRAKNRKTGYPPSEKHVPEKKTYNLPDGVRFEKFITPGEEKRRQGLQKVLFFPNGSSSGGKIIFSNTKGQRYLIQVDFITGFTKLISVSK